MITPLVITSIPLSPEQCHDGLIAISGGCSITVNIDGQPYVPEGETCKCYLGILGYDGTALDLTSSVVTGAYGLTTVFDRGAYNIPVDISFTADVSGTPTVFNLTAYAKGGSTPSEKLVGSAYTHGVVKVGSSSTSNTRRPVNQLAASLVAFVDYSGSEDVDIIPSFPTLTAHMLRGLNAVAVVPWNTSPPPPPPPPPPTGDSTLRINIWQYPSGSGDPVGDRVPVSYPSTGYVDAYISVDNGVTPSYHWQGNLGVGTTPETYDWTNLGAATYNITVGTIGGPVAGWYTFNSGISDVAVVIDGSATIFEADLYFSNSAL